MNFFEAQDNARQSTGRMVLFFVLAVLTIVLMTNLLVMVVFGFVDTREVTAATVLSQFDWQVFGAIGAGVIAIVTLGSLYKIMSLSGGGASVAEMMGGELIVDGTGDTNKQKILNVVEEMAIASGSPVPPVYLLHEPGINAFAAGYSTSDAVIGVTSGAIETLSRDELQGVIAHEFSHILNGDMRLNIRLIGMLHGILLIGLIGYYIMRSTSRSSRGSKNSGGGIVFLGIGLMIIGYSGTFFGNLIKAAVSRQREFLADASAVQFTRNPDGIGGALIRIGASQAGSILVNANSSEISHALFSQGFTGFFSSLFATHPPLAERISRVLPDWDGSFDSSRASRTVTEHIRAQEDADELRIKATMAAGIAASMQNETAFKHIGRPNAVHLGYAHQLIQEIPELLKKAAHNPYAARAVVYFLLLDHDPVIRDRQLEHLSTAADHGVYQETMKLVIKIGSVGHEYRLPLVDMALPALRQLTPDQYVLFQNNLNALIEMDGRVSLFEWSIRKIVLHHLELVFSNKPAGGKHDLSMEQAGKSCAVLLSVLAYSSEQKGLNHQETFAKGAAKLDVKIHLLPKNEISRDKLDSSLNELAGLKPMDKEKLLKACGACAAADGHIAPVEAELVRVIADTLDCPVPPFIV
ncbi:MAG: M48 family metallopeptidase [Proteobacteria bacterium]|nr:M48 family metallopeptidase [Pseudomonadota bacterium]MBU1737749.1 M48 family metallopeptidase [Pseudomonadota bacterium]